MAGRRENVECTLLDSPPFRRDKGASHFAHLYRVATSRARASRKAARTLSKADRAFVVLPPLRRVNTWRLRSGSRS